jgi:hypothetical protein
MHPTMLEQSKNDFKSTFAQHKQRRAVTGRGRTQINLANSGFKDLKVQMGNYTLSRQRVNAITNSSKLYTQTKRTIEMMYGDQRRTNITASNATKPETIVSNFQSQHSRPIDRLDLKLTK